MPNGRRGREPRTRTGVTDPSVFHTAGPGQRELRQNRAEDANDLLRIGSLFGRDDSSDRSFNERSLDDLRGSPFDPRAGDFDVGGTGVSAPGQELEVRGLNDFLKAQNRFRATNQGFRAQADQAGLADAVARNRARAQSSFDVAEGAAERRQRGLGLTLTKRQQRAQDRRFNLSRAVADADAATSTRRSFRKTATAAATAAGGIEESLRETEIGALTGLSNAAGQEKIRRADEAAARKESRSGIFGSIIGIGASFFSSEDLKDNKRPVIATEGSLLDRLKKVRVEKWKYKGDETDHIGPYAEEFNRTFNVGEDNKQMINVGDSLGVLMGAIKELDAKVDARA